MNTRFEPRIPRMSSWKNFTSWFWTLDPCISGKYFVTGPSTQISIIFHISILVQFRTTKDSFLLVTFTGLANLFPPPVSLNQQLCGNYVSCIGRPMSKYIHLLQGSWVRILGVNINIFPCWHPWETMFKSGFHSSFWDFKCRIWKWGMATG